METEKVAKSFFHKIYIFFMQSNILKKNQNYCIMLWTRF